MKRNLIWILFIAAAGSLLYFTRVVAEPDGAPGYYTGAPGESTCATPGCHNDPRFGSANLISNSKAISLSFVNNGDTTQTIAAGQTYDVIVTAHWPSARAFGFETTVENSARQHVGTLAVNGDNSVKIVYSNRYATHRNPDELAPGMDKWTFKWTAPASPASNITFYTAVNAANGNGSNTGDTILTRAFPVTVNTGIANAGQIFSDAISLYPNPVTNRFIVHYDGDEAHAEVLDLSGRKYAEISEASHGVLVFDAFSLPAGVYLLKITSGNLTGVKKFIRN